MRIPIEETKPAARHIQYKLFEEDRYKYRIFCTTLTGLAEKIIDEYDKRTDVENLVGESKREGLSAIPSNRFKNNYAFFQLVMLSYNIWRYIKMIALWPTATRKAMRDNSRESNPTPIELRG